jgi:predicted phage tail protein
MIEKPRKIIRGSGDDEDSGGSRAPVVQRDSLRSTSFLKILDLICEGEIIGLVDGSKSIYLNNTVLQNDDDTYNFQNVEWIQRRGTQNQEYIPDNSASEREVPVSAQFKYGNPNSGAQPSNTAQGGTAIVRTVVDPNVTAVRFRISVPALSTTNSINGDVTGAYVAYSLWVKASDDVDWVKKLEDAFSGKSSSKYERTRRVDLHGAGPWLIRVVRDTPDADNNFVQNSTVWESYTEITDAKLTYPNSALIGMRIEATQFSSVPSRIYEMDLLKIQVPSNYDDVTRTYTGVWDGTFQISTGACSNPAWVFYDLIRSERYGLGQYISEDQINKWALYEIGRYCDELVDDGDGGTEPRFTCNVFIPGRTEAYNLLKSLASVFRGMIYWAGGAVTAVQDSPRDPVYLYNQSNVVDGRFTYQGASAQTRHSVARVSWNDPSNFYQETVEYVEDQDLIREIGVIETEITAFGCTSRGQAIRLGKWLLYTERYESETLMFSTGLEGLACAPGDIIQVSDPSRAGAVMGGRTSAATLTTLTVDRDIDTDLVGSILALLPDGTVEEKPIVSIVGRLVTTGQAFSQAPQPHGAWIIKTAEVEPQLFRVIGVNEEESGVYTVSALRHNPSKFDFIEQGLILETPSTSILNEAPDTPENLQVVESLFAAGTEVRTRATFSWRRVPLAANYRVAYSFEGGNAASLPLTQFNEVQIDDVVPGNYVFSVVAINSLGKESPPASISYEVSGKTTPPQDVQDFSMIPSQGNAYLTWRRATDLDVIIGGYVRIRWTPKITGQAWADGIDITPALTGNSTSLVAGLLPGTYMAKFVDSSGNFSVNPKLIVTNVADIYAQNRIQTIEEHPTFDGVKDQMFYVDSEQAITLISATLIDDVLDIDSLGSWDFMGDIVASGQYYFDEAMDLGGVWPFKVRVHVDLEAYDVGNYFDQRFDLIDDWVSFDGDVIEALNAQVYMRTTEDDPSGSPTWSEWKKILNAEYRAWGAEFKIVCENDEPNHNLYIRELGVVIDMDDRTWSSPKLTSSAIADLHVEYDHEFFEIPSIGVTEENMDTGDYKTISNVTETGFDISFYDSTGTRVVRDFYVLAKSFGLRLT